ncbi:MAG: molybdopterin-binding protein, partial [Burkholderiaceae bacterium]
PGQPLKPGALYNSNRFMLLALLRRLGCVVDDLGQIRDSLDATRAALQRAAAANDLVVTCGGMSVGEEDHVRPAVQADGELTMWNIAVKPGKPLAHGRLRRADGGSAEFLGLPGNPVSALVTFLMFGRPFILRLQGAGELAPPRLTLRADFDWPRPDRRREFLRARINADGGLELFPNQGSAVLTSTVWADGLIDNPAGQAIARGQPVSFIPFAELLG